MEVFLVADAFDGLVAGWGIGHVLRALRRAVAAGADAPVRGRVDDGGSTAAIALAESAGPEPAALVRPRLHAGPREDRGAAACGISPRSAARLRGMRESDRAGHACQNSEDRA